MGYLKRLLGQQEGILFDTNQHWTAFLGRTWHLIFLFVLALAIAVFVNLQLKPLALSWPWVDNLLERQGLLLRAGVAVVLLIYPVAALVIRYLRWQAERYVVTNLRVIQLKGILSKRVLDSSLEKVNDVMLEQSLLGRLLDYGDLQILTASELAVNKFERLARPLAFKAVMLNAKHKLEGNGRDGREDPARLIGDLARLRDQGIITDVEFEEKKARLLGKL